MLETANGAITYSNGAATVYSGEGTATVQITSYNTAGVVISAPNVTVQNLTMSTLHFFISKHYRTAYKSSTYCYLVFTFLVLYY